MKINKRIEYIKNNYDFIDVEDINHDYKIISYLKNDVNKPFLVINNLTGKEFLSTLVLQELERIDPTNKKLYTQWMSDILFKFVKSSNHTSLKRFIDEDANQIKDGLIEFDRLKKTKIFKESVEHIQALNSIKDKCNINQYKSIEYVYTAIDPFMDKGTTNILNVVKNAVNIKLGKCVFEDHKFYIYAPNSLAGSVIFSEFSYWCTASQGNSMFNKYTSKTKPNGSRSDLLVVIDKELSTLYQIHFESNQVNTHTNSNDVNGFINNYLSKSDALCGFFKNYLYNLLMECLNKANYKKKLSGNIGELSEIYSNYLLKFGFLNTILNITSKDKSIVDITSGKSKTFEEIDLSDFNNLTVIKLANLNLKTFPILKKRNVVEVISLHNNNITYLPEDLSCLRKLKSLNISKNNIKYISEDIKQLDPINGGSLLLLCVRENPLTIESLRTIKDNLPSVKILY